MGELAQSLSDSALHVTVETGFKWAGVFGDFLTGSFVDLYRGWNGSQPNERSACRQ